MTKFQMFSISIIKFEAIASNKFVSSMFIDVIFLIFDIKKI